MHHKHSCYVLLSALILSIYLHHRHTHYDWKLGRSVANIFMILVDIQPILLVEMRQAFFESTHKVKHLPSWMVTAFPFYSSYIPFLLAKYIMSALFWA